MIETSGAAVAVTGALVTVGGLIHSIWKSRKDAKLGISEQEITGRRDTIADRDSLIDQFQEMLDTERKARHQKESELESRVASLESDLREEREYIDDLRHHIYTQKPPPPPPRRPRPEALPPTALA